MLRSRSVGVNKNGVERGSIEFRVKIPRPGFRDPTLFLGKRIF